MEINMMTMINTVIRGLIIVVCVLGITFCLTLAMRFRNSIFAIMSALLAGGFLIILIGKALAIAGNFIPDFKVVSQVHEIIGFCGLLLMITGLIALLTTARKKESELIRNAN